MAYGAHSRLTGSHSIHKHKISEAPLAVSVQKLAECHLVPEANVRQGGTYLRLTQFPNKR